MFSPGAKPPFMSLQELKLVAIKLTLHRMLAIVLLMSLAETAAAGALEDADAAVKRRDYATAVRLIRPLAEQGDANAQYTLGVFYDNGLGVPQDRTRSYMWFDLSAAQGREGAAAFRDLIARRMTPVQIAEAQKLAREWKPSSRPPR
jgi:TPR repeat protein